MSLETIVSTVKSSSVSALEFGSSIPTTLRGLKLQRNARHDIDRAVVLSVDLALFLAAAVLGLILRDNLQLDPVRFTAMVPYLVATGAFFMVLLMVAGIDRSLWQYLTTQDHVRGLIVVVGAVVSGTIVCWLTDAMVGVARSVPVLHVILAAFLLTCARIFWRAFAQSGMERLSAASEPGAFDAPTGVLVVGLTTQTDLFLRAVERGQLGHVRISGIYVDDHAYHGRLVGRHLVFGPGENLRDLIKRLSVHGATVGQIVVTCARADLSPAIGDELAAIQATGLADVTHLEDEPSLSAPCGARTGGDGTHEDGAGVCDAQAGGDRGTDPSEAVAFDTPAVAARTRRPFWALKRIVDICGSSALLVLLAPVIMVVAGVVLWTLGRPLIFWQDRPGYLGRTFRVFKFRTMHNAHDRFGNRLSDEERQSAVGAFLRKTRLDELPQLWNIFVGEMSFVGPRPLLPVDQHPSYAARLLVRPGLTGWAQVVGGRKISAADKAALDIWYACHATFTLEAKVLVRTVRMVLRGETLDHEIVAQTWDELTADRIVPKAPARIGRYAMEGAPGLLPTAAAAAAQAAVPLFRPQSGSSSVDQAGPRMSGGPGKRDGQSKVSDAA